MTWRLLLVEDDDDARTSLAAMLEARGYRVIAAANGRDAIERVHFFGVRPSLVLLDWIMPVMGGEGFLAAQPDDPLLAHVPVLLQTAQLLHPSTLPPTVRAVLAKPLHFPQLLAALEQIWDERTPVPAPRLAKGTGGVPQELLTGPDPVPPEPEPPSPAPAADAQPILRPPSEP
jgi:CheY-like chemotaxis protein